MSSGVYTGKVVRIEPGGPVVVVSALARQAEFGPVVSGVPDLQAGDAVLVANLDGTRDQLVILSRTYGRAPHIGEIDDLAERLDDGDAHDAAQDSRLTGLESTTATQGGRLSAVEGRAGALETRAGAIEAVDTAQDARLTTTEGVANGAAAGIVALRGDTAGKVTAKGDLLTGSGAGTLARLGVGTDGLDLVADSTAPTGLAYAERRGAPMPVAGSLAPSRYCGATASGPPTTGTYQVGDWVVSQDLGDVWICTAAGAPGTWRSNAAVLRTALFGGPARTRPHKYICRLNTTWAIPPNSDRWAVGSQWTTNFDPDGAHVNDASGPGWKAPLAGRLWDVQYKLTSKGASAGGLTTTYRLAGKIGFNLDVFQSVASDSVIFPIQQTDGEVWMDAQTFGAQIGINSILRWSSWSNANVSILASQFGYAFSEVVIRDAGPS